MPKEGIKAVVCANTGQNQRVSNLLFSVSSYILVLRFANVVVLNNVMGILIGDKKDSLTKK